MKTRKITIALLEAHFNATKILLDYIIRKKKTDPSATRPLALWNKKRNNERPMVLDQSEAVFGFAALLTTLEKEMKVGEMHDATEIATLAQEFCMANKFSTPAPGYHNRLRMPKVNKNEIH